MTSLEQYGRILKLFSYNLKIGVGVGRTCTCDKVNWSVTCAMIQASATTLVQ